MKKRVLSLLLCLVMALSLIPTTVFADYSDGVECQNCGAWRYDDWKCDNGDHCAVGVGCGDDIHCPDCGACYYEVGDWCDYCGRCYDCVDKCVGCSDAIGDSMCIECCGDENHCPECYSCYYEVGDWCDSCGRCYDCVDKCEGCSGNVETSICTTCCSEYHCPECGESYYEVGDWCDVCGKCYECVDYCEDCSGNVENSICKECCADYHCSECGGSYFLAESKCDYCDRCSNCVNICDECDLCDECALDGGYHCPGCGTCEDIMRCQGCWEVCEECADGWCASCDMCLDCAVANGHHCPNCGACGEEGVICPECGEVCSECAEYCSDHEMCVECAADGGHHCPNCGACSEDVGICWCGEVCEECADDWCDNCGLCVDCAIDACYHCPSCGTCGEDAMICPECGDVCSDCADAWCDNCGMCVDCAVANGLHCPSCEVCGEDVTLCRGCGVCGDCADEWCEMCERCVDCADEWCDKCEMCVDCAIAQSLHCPNCGMCGVDAIICPLCNVVCDQCDDDWRYDGCEVCMNCAIANGLRCPVCKECYKNVDKCETGEHCVDCCDCTAKCAAPKIAISNNASTGKPRLSWAKVDGATQYEVYRATSKTGTYSKLTTTSNLYLNNTSAVAGTTYYYKVRALNSKGVASEYSNIAYITCDCAKPVVNIAANSNGKPYLTWAKVDGATSYEVYYATSAGGEFTKLYTTSNLYLNHNSAEAGKTYYYKVLALSSKSSYATSAYSDVVSFTVAGNTAPAAPSISISNNASTGKPRLSWKAVSGATQYEVYRATSKTGTYSKLTTTSNLYLNNTSAVAGTTYYYKVRALNAGGTAGEYSNIVYITCDCAKPVVSIKLNSSNHPYLSWAKVDGATSYEVYYATSAGGEFTKLYTTSNLYLNHNSAKAGTTYYYKVLALSSKSSYATSAYSDVVSIKAK